jgi:glycine/D-amino acid oxidase-like deaminating enzyme
MNPSPKFTPYWWEAAPPEPQPVLDVDATSDAVIVGAGYAGLSAALVLARAGRSVQVFDAGDPGIGASTRSGGIASGNLYPSITSLIKKYGPLRATEMYAEGVAARADIKRFIEDEGIDCMFSLSGRFTGASRPEHYDGLARDADLLNENFDLGAFVVPRENQKDEMGTDLYHGGIVRPDIGGLHPAMLLKGILDKTLEAGAKVLAQTRVEGIRRDGDEFEVFTTRGRVRTRQVLVCTNGYTDGGIPWLRRRLVPVASQILVTDEISPNMMETLMPKRRMAGETRIMSNYYRPTPDGKRILMGGRIYDKGEPDQPLPYDRLYNRLTTLFPEIDGVGVSHVWWGYVAFPVEKVPHLVERDGVLYATGFSGSGVVWARWFGQKAGYRMLGDEAGASAFADRVFTAIPFYEGRPWFLPAIQAWYGMRDRLGV